MWTNLSRLVERAIGAACEGVLYVATGAIFAILSANVILRYGTGTSLQWASELPELLFPWLVVAGIVLATQHGNHIAVVLVTQRLPASTRRCVLAAGSVATIALYSILAGAAWELMPIAADELSPMLHVPGSVTIAALMIGFLLVAIVTLLQFVQSLSPIAAAAPAPAAVPLEEVHP